LEDQIAIGTGGDEPHDEPARPVATRAQRANDARREETDQQRSES
jgi:hypothetical protein